MITFATQEDFEKAVMQVLLERLKVGVTVSKESASYYGDDQSTKVKVTLFDAASGDDIDSSFDYA